MTRYLKISVKTFRVILTSSDLFDFFNENDVMHQQFVVKILAFFSNCTLKWLKRQLFDYWYTEQELLSITISSVSNRKKLLFYTYKLKQVHTQNFFIIKCDNK